MRSRLLGSALKIVAQNGPGATSIDDVISAAQVSRGTFYNYFDSPDALVRVLATEIAYELVRMAEPLVLKHDDPAERVASGMRIFIRLAIRHSVVGGFMLRLGWPDLDQRQVLFDFVRRDLEEGLRRQRLAKMPLALAINIVSGTVIGTIHSMLHGATESDFVEQAVASALRALGIEDKEARRISGVKLFVPPCIEGGLIAGTINGESPNPKRADLGSGVIRGGNTSV